MLLQWYNVCGVCMHALCKYVHSNYIHAFSNTYVIGCVNPVIITIITTSVHR